MTFSAILFDLDGTLVDSLPGIEYSVDQALAAANQVPRSGSLRPLIGPPIRTIFSQIIDGATGDDLSGLEHAFRRSYDDHGWQRTALHQNALTTLRALHESGIPLFVVTNKPAQPTRQILRRLGIEDFFVGSFSRDSRKPSYSSKEEMLRDVCKTYRFNPSECLYVGDTPDDCRAGMEANVPVAVVPHGYGGFDLNQPPASCRVLNDLADLLVTVQAATVQTLERS